MRLLLKSGGVIWLNFSYFTSFFRSQVNGLAYTIISAATTDIRHGHIDIFICWMWISFQQCDSRHDLSTLAVAALWDVCFIPGKLYRMRAIFAQPFDGCHFCIFDCRYRQGAGPHRIIVYQYCAGATLSNAATEF